MIAPPPLPSKVHLDVVGVRLALESHLPSVLDHAAHDFYYFLSENKDAHLRVQILPLFKLPKWKRLFKLGRSTLYVSGRGERRVCFFDQAFVAYRYDDGQCLIYADEAVCAYQACYYVMLSFIGEKLDRRGIHRLHGLAMAWKDRATVLMAPSGAGKSSLVLKLLAEPDFGLYSDDIALLNRQGELLPFPLRIAVAEKPDIDPEHIRRFHPHGHSPKYIIRSSYFQQRVPTAARLEVLGCLVRGTETKWSWISPLRLIWPLLRWLVLGHETPQIWELFLRFGPRDLMSRPRILFSRVRLAIRVWATCQPVRFEIEQTTPVLPSTGAQPEWVSANP